MSSLPIIPSCNPVSDNIPSILPIFSSPSFPSSALTSNSMFSGNMCSIPTSGEPTGNNHTTSQASIAPGTNFDENNSKNNDHNTVFKSKVLSFNYQNVRGLRTKCLELYMSSIACVYEIIAFSETWLNSSIYDSELFHSDFVVYRCDRTAQTSTFSRGGGVLISVKSIYSSEQICVPSAEALEIVFVKVQMKVKLYVCLLFIHTSFQRQ